MVASCFKNLLAGNHHAQIVHFEAITGEDHANDVLADIMNIALYSSHDDSSRRALVGIGSFILFHKGGEPRDSLFHDPGRLYYLGEKHFTLSEKVSHDRHAIHKWAFNDLQWTAILLSGLFSVRVDEFGNSLQ